jgi:hypothetical protein
MFEKRVMLLHPLIGFQGIYNEDMKDRAKHLAAKGQHSIEPQTLGCSGKGSNRSYTNAQLLLKIAFANFGRFDGRADSADVLAV